jgi:hypothetical protein
MVPWESKTCASRHAECLSPPPPTTKSTSSSTSTRDLTVPTITMLGFRLFEFYPSYPFKTERNGNALEGGLVWQ